jgi:hypothetical protein
MSNIGTRLQDEVDRIGGVSIVAAHLKTARNTIYNWIQKDNIPANKLAQLKKLGADVNYILTGEIGARETLPPREIALLDHYRHSDEESKKVIEKVAFATAKPDEADLINNQRRKS